MKEVNVTWNHVDPEPVWLDFEGAHFPIYGNLAFFYRLFSWDRPEEYVQEQLRPWLSIAKRNWTGKKSCATTVNDNAVSAQSA